ncbi:MAG: hypothetical protein AAGE84_04190 [Cyanobacteria bacterium P01_G01_bin.39]
MTEVYPDLARAVRGVCEHWCAENGYSDLFLHNGEYWAFPPNGVIPIALKEALSSKEKYGREVRIGRVSIMLMPDGSFCTDRIRV